MAEEENNEEMEVYSSSKAAWMDNFAGLRPDLFFPDDLPETDREMILEEIRPHKLKTAMFSSIPMICRAKDCPMAKSCPLQQQGKAPKGYKCPYEMALVNDISESLMEELNVDPNSYLEVSMIRDLADQEVQYIRKSHRLALEDFIAENVIGINEKTGEPMKVQSLHIASELEDRIHKRRRDIRKELLASREARAKAGQAEIDPSVAISRMMEAAKEIENAQANAVRMALGKPRVDEYIQADMEIAEAEIIDDQD